MFLITGITGKVGGAAARQLLRQGHQIRALVRDPQKAAAWAEQGVEIHQGDFNDTNAITAALKGVEGAFLMLPPMMSPSPGFPEHKAMIASYVEALHNAPPPRIVVLSSVGSEKTSGLGLITVTHLLEEAFSALTFPVAFVRAGGFFENFTYALHTAASGPSAGWFDTFYKPVDRKFPMIATEDIGNQVAHLLTTEWPGSPSRRIVELGSPVSADDLAQSLSEVLGKPVQARSIPREQWSAVLQAQGFPAGTTSAFEEMEDAINSGWIDFGAPGTEKVAGNLTPTQVFHRAKAS